MTYVQQQFASLEPEASFDFKIKLQSNFGRTNWFTISPKALKEIEAILEKEYEIK